MDTDFLTGEPKSRPRKIPRPRNSWILFRAQMWRNLADKNPDSTESQSSLSKIISKMWKEVEPETKSYFERLAETEKFEHAKKYPDYRYVPRSKEEKEREREENRRLKVEERSRVKCSKRRVTPSSECHNTFVLGKLTYHAPDSCKVTPPLSAANSPSPPSIWSDLSHLPHINSCYLDSASSIPTLDPVMPFPAAIQRAQRSHHHVKLDHLDDCLQSSNTTDQQKHGHDRSFPHRAHQNSIYMVARQRHQKQKQQHYQFLQSEPTRIVSPLISPIHQIHPLSSENATPYTFSDSCATTPSSTDDFFTFGLPSPTVKIMEAWASDNSDLQSFYDQALNNGNASDCSRFQQELVDQPNIPDSTSPLEVEVANMFALNNMLRDETLESPSPNIQGWDLVAQRNLLPLPEGQTFTPLVVNGISSVADGPSQPPLQLGSQAKIFPAYSSLLPMNEIDSFAVASTQPYFEISPSINLAYFNGCDTDHTGFESLFANFINPDSFEDRSSTTEVPVHVPYRPPSGAGLFSKRRVAASWDRSCAISNFSDVSA